VQVLITFAIKVYKYVTAEEFQKPEWLWRAIGCEADGPSVLDYIRGILPGEYAFTVSSSTSIG